MAEQYKNPAMQADTLLKRVDQKDIDKEWQEERDAVAELDKGNPYDPENLPNEGMSKEELEKALAFKEGKEYHDIMSRQWFKLNKIDGDRVHLISPNGYRMMTMDEFKKMVAQSPLNEPNTETQRIVNGGK